jgi:hypothetical protein
MTASGTFIGGASIGLMAGGAAITGGAVGYGIYKLAVEDMIEWAGDKLYDRIVNPEMKKERRTGKIVPGTEEVHNVQHGKWPPGHRHWLEKHTDPKTGKERLVRRHGPPDDSTPKPPDTGQEQEDNSGGAGVIPPPQKTCEK